MRPQPTDAPEAPEAYNGRYIRHNPSDGQRNIGTAVAIWNPARRVFEVTRTGRVVDTSPGVREFSDLLDYLRAGIWTRDLPAGVVVNRGL